MKDLSRYVGWAAAILAILIVLYSLGYLSFLFPSGTILQLQSVEVRDYNGTRLSSVGDFHENSIKGPQYVDNSTYRLKIYGLVDRSLNLSYSDVIGQNQNYQKVVGLDCVEGWSVKILWQGVLLKDLITKAGPKSGADTVILRAYDGYSTSFPLSYIQDNDIMLAYKMNNVTLPPERGYPFQLVAESKWGYKWIKWVTDVELSNNSGYLGYWESRGYSGSGDRNSSFFGP